MVYPKFCAGTSREADLEAPDFDNAGHIFGIVDILPICSEAAFAFDLPCCLSIALPIL